MATKAKAAAKKGTALGGAPAPVKPKVTGVKNPTVAHVNDKNGDKLRTYSKSEHGDAFLEHATEFAGKEEGRAVVTE